MSKKLIEDILDLKTTDTVPVALWWHFTTRQEWAERRGSEPDIFERALRGHIDYARNAHLDLLKVMPDVYMVPPNLDGVNVLDAKALSEVKSVSTHDPYYEDQVRLIKGITDELGDATAVFPTVFSPYYYLLNSQLHVTHKEIEVSDLAKAVAEHPEELKAAVDVVAEDLITLSERLLTEAGATGIFFAVHKLKGISQEDYDKIFAPAEQKIAAKIAEIRNYTILHVCGENGIDNDLSYYNEHIAFRALNYAIANEKVSVKEAKERFTDKVILGGFSNKPGTLLYTAGKEELQNAIRAFVEENGRDRLIIGADCAIDPDAFAEERVGWIQEAL